MKVHVLQHVPYEDIGSMATWVENIRAYVGYTRFFESPVLPRPNGLDLVIIMGGPMSVNDESTLPWLRAEKKFIRDAIESGVPVLGVCLGAQLIASALGARVYRNSHKEIGWFPVEAIPGAMNTFNFPEKCTVFHWHGETFDLPPRAVHLAKSAVCENQAFQIGRNVIGLQFHLEATPDSIRSILDNSDAPVPGPYIQSESELRRATSTAYVKINKLMDDMLFYITNTRSM